MARDAPRVRPSATAFFHAWGAGDQTALDQLLPLMYVELRRVARRLMRMESAGHSLQPTALVHEAYLRLIDVTRVDCASRTQFLALAAGMMRRVLVDHARSRKRIKRGAGVSIVPLEDDAPAAVSANWDVVALDEALTRLAALSPKLARVIELRFFGGLTIEETAEVLTTSPATIKRNWTTARAWLFREMQSGPASPASRTNRSHT